MCLFDNLNIVLNVCKLWESATEALTKSGTQVRAEKVELNQQDLKTVQSKVSSGKPKNKVYPCLYREQTLNPTKEQEATAHSQQHRDRVLAASTLL